MSGISPNGTCQLFDLTGKIALITGGSGHLGSAFSATLAELGAHVLIGARDAAKAAPLAESLRSSGLTADPFAIGIGDAVASQEAVNQIIGRHGRIDILINNAYAFLEKRIDEISDEEINKTLEIGLTGTFRLSQQVAEQMKKTGGGSIINIASMYGMVGSYPDVYKGTPACISPSYHMAKGGLIQLTRYLAVYWAEHGIRVNAISPGAFPKEAVREKLPEFLGRLEDRIPMKRIGRPEELKGAIALLASQAGSYITGQNLVVDGGWTAW
jgi:gluconate 5-dehydrogenase